MLQSRTFVIGMAIFLVTIAFAPTSAAVQTEESSISVNTQEATDITESSALLQGNLTHINESLESTKVYFKYWIRGDRANDTTIEAGELDQAGEFKAHLTGLENNTTYVYQAYAEANETTVNGSEVPFTTAREGILLEVESEDATNITNSSAIVNGNLTALDENATNTTVWFQYWERGDRSTTVLTDPTDVNSTGAFSEEISNLTAGETYIYRAHAQTNATDVNYTANDRGENREFTIFTGEFSVETFDASDVTNTSATLNGRLNGLPNSSMANLSFTYWEKGDSENTTTIEAGSLSEPGEFSTDVTGFENNTTYVYVAQARTNGETAAGSNVTFTTGTGEESPSYSGEMPFGQWLAELIHEEKDDVEGPFGQWLSTIVHKNNPSESDDQPNNSSASKKSTEGGQDEEDEDENETEVRDEDHEVPNGDNGPPKHASNGKNATDKGDSNGPPEHANNDRSDSASESNDDEEQKSDDKDNDNNGEKGEAGDNGDKADKNKKNGEGKPIDKDEETDEQTDGDEDEDNDESNNEEGDQHPGKGQGVGNGEGPP